MSTNNIQQEQRQKKIGGETYPDGPPTYLSPDEAGIETREHDIHCRKAESGSRKFLQAMKIHYG